MPKSNHTYERETSQLKASFRLADLDPGQAAIVLAVLAPGQVGRRLLDLGLVPGTRVVALRRSPLGDPTAYAVRGTVIALRLDTAREILVQPLGVEPQP